MSSPSFQIIVSDSSLPPFTAQQRTVEAAGGTLTVRQCRTEAELIAECARADALIVQWAPVTAAVIAALAHCRVIVRLGIGVDNVDLAAARARGIPVCNVPDYCIDEVADHSVALALAVARQLPRIDRRMRGGAWKITPDAPMPAFRQMVFATAGFGRIARAVLARMRGFGCKLAAYDPYVPAENMQAEGVAKLTRDELFAQADILSLHLPLMADTKHFLRAETLAKMKPTAIVVNTARGGLIDTQELARALGARTIAGAGLDVYETEPLPADHPLLGADHLLMTSHVAWFSDASLPELQTRAVEEALRVFRGEPLRNQVNKG